MATSTVSSGATLPTSSRVRYLRAFLFTLVLLLVIVASASAWFWHAAHSGLPQVEGTVRIPGLKARVTALRDAQGVPNITAASLDDLFFAQGYVTAQDRLWQMDLQRRFAAGELAEIFGSKYLKSDMRQRYLQIRWAAERAAQQLNPRDRAFLEAYARGVNAYIDQHRGDLPVEFRVLRYEPRPWTPLDSMLTGAMMVEMLADPAIAHMLSRERISAQVGPELAADLYPNSSWRDHPPAQNAAAFDQPDTEQQEAEQSELKRRGSEPDAEPAPRATRHHHRRAHRAAVQYEDASSTLATLFPGAAATVPGDAPLVPGSNNWVVSGAHTATGKPMLSNDMHLGHNVPGIWYEAHLKCSGPDPNNAADCARYDVAGVTLPGMPFVIVGHNQRVGWGFTNIGPAVQDLYIENFNANGDYQTPQGFQKPEHRREVIHVRRTMLLRSTREVPLDVIVTRHGPVITPVLTAETRQLALRWTAYDPGTLALPFFDIDSAQNWDEFQRAFSQFGAPAQNVVYADVDGHIGYHATGKVPIRASGTGAAPVSGADDAHEWTGYIPFDQLPKVYDPPSGIIATANGRITPDDSPLAISNEWGPPYRTERIYQLLGHKDKLTAPEMLAIQTDTYSAFDKFFAERFTYAIDHAAKSSARARQAADILRKWDGNVTADSAAATITAKARRQLAADLLEPRLREDWREYNWFMSSVWLESVVTHQSPRWLPDNYRNYDELLAASVEKAIGQSGVPGNLSQWRWGRHMEINLRHPLFGSLPFLSGRASTGTFEQSGNGYTVKQVGNTFGPSERLTVDFANLDASTLNIVLGQGENIFSPHFKDQWKAWFNGTTYGLPFSDAAVQAAAKQKLVLEP